MSDDAPISPLAPAESPLAEADPNSINELIEQRIDAIFNKPPILLSDTDLRFAVEFYRTQRAKFLVESEAKANKPPRVAGAKRKAPTSVAAALSQADDLL